MHDLPELDPMSPGFSTRSEEVLRARDVTWCARTPYGFAVLRHKQAGHLLRDRRLRQGSHAWPARVNLQGSFAEFWRRSVISMEGAPHKQLRRIAQSALSPDDLNALHPRFQSIADDLLEQMPRNTPVAFMSAFSEPFAGRAIIALLGAPSHLSEQVSHDASALGLAMGRDAAHHPRAINVAYDRLRNLSFELLRDPPSGGYVARLLSAAADLGVDDPETLSDLVVISIFGGVDTTRAQLGFALYLLAKHPAQWTVLRQDTTLIPQALEEVIRTRPTTTWATREALEDFEFEGVGIRAGDTLHIFVHASSTDDVSGFDIQARRKPHFGFGGGSHHCLGHQVARTDMAAALGSLLNHWSEIELAGEPQFLPESGNTSPTHLPLLPTWA